MQPLLFTRKYWVSVLAVVSMMNAVNAQPSKEEVAKLISNKNFLFRAQQAMPTGGRTRQLTSEYDLQVKKDTIVTFLPYFGRAFNAPIDPSKGGIDFTTTDFEYNISPARKSGWNISIKPKDGNDVQEMTLSVSESGYGTLLVRSNNRQQISYYGVIDAPRQTRKTQ